ncbi:hypothetical protein SNOG_07440 [Parastagonospora nodorum SN15]|uniref:Uncharacterized protein n=1 Tax=Phaeosphaeria nodorum (strain SN15 / ATCC MYA-4574 / FGSC 10173) TaxID=321614 RepID=Q0ULC4_PHANO|nr:hypothetical protein SNOG_07440 [Parastagonospora nodorum SN15]EAT84906.1 hypothetical protein SNOG_07440 [Parastagonospora nodorum SN15]
MRYHWLPEVLDYAGYGARSGHSGCDLRHSSFNQDPRYIKE